MHTPHGQDDVAGTADATDAAARERLETWAALLAHWTSFAQAAVALPKDAAGERWRASVPAIIALQGIAMALGELDLLAQRRGAAEYAVGVDRAAISIREHAAALNAAWRGEIMPVGVVELMEDARAALEAARHAGVELAAPAPGAAPGNEDLIAALLALGFAGDLFLLPPGTRHDAGAPLAFISLPGGVPLSPQLRGAILRWGPPGAATTRGTMRQIYRRTAADGSAVDTITPLTDTLPAGQPMLVPFIERGRPVTAR